MRCFFTYRQAELLAKIQTQPLAPSCSETLNSEPSAGSQYLKEFLFQLLTMRPECSQIIPFFQQPVKVTPCCPTNAEIFRAVYHAVHPNPKVA